MLSGHKRRTAALLLLVAVVSIPVSAQRKPDGDAPTLRIYLARHGQTDWNLEGRTQGEKDIPLNETGKQQAEQLKARLAGIPLSTVYSSTLGRSRQTAEIVHGQTPIVSLPNLR